jgi:hypothetical protein
MQFKLACVCCGHQEIRDIPSGEKEVWCTHCLGPVTVLGVIRPLKEGDIGLEDIHTSEVIKT